MKYLIIVMTLALAPFMVLAQEKLPLRCPDGNHPHAIDLGLPSGTKWACCNVGSSSPEFSGNYYAWGETETKEVFLCDNYEYKNPENVFGFQFLGKNISATQFDVAAVKWGAPWRIPTYEECKELVDSCRTYIIRDSHDDCILLIGPNGNGIYMPLTGFRESENLHEKNSKGYYWTSIPDESDSMLANFMNIDIFPSVYLGCRNCGYSVRPVRK